VKVKQNIAKKNQSWCVARVLLDIRMKKRSGFSGFVLRAKMLGATEDGVNGGIGLGVGRSSKAGEN